MSIHDHSPFWTYSPTSDPQPHGSVQFSKAFRDLVGRSRIGSEQIRTATLREVHATLEAARAYFPVVADAIAETVYRLNPEYFLIVDNGGAGARPAMAFLPLTAEGTAALVDGTFDASDPSPTHVAPTIGQAESVYCWLIFSPGKLIAGLRLLAELESRTGGLPLFQRPASAESSKLSDMIGYLHARDLFPSAPNWLRVAICERPDTASSANIRVVRTMDDLTKVFLVRSLSYIAEQSCPYAEEFDGNDFAGTHFLAEVGGEPVGCVRIRYFGGFAKLERLAVRPEFRRSRVMWQIVRGAFDFCARKGFTTLYAHAREDLVPAWERFGAKLMPRPAFSFSGVQFREMVLQLPASRASLKLGEDPLKLVRPEGEWDRLGPLDRAQLYEISDRGSAFKKLR